MNKTKRMLKNAAISVGIGAVPAFVVLWLCNLFMKVNELTLHSKNNDVQNTHNYAFDDRYYRNAFCNGVFYKQR